MISTLLGILAQATQPAPAPAASAKAPVTLFPTGLRPPEASEFAKDVDFTFDYIFWVSLFFFVLMMGAMFYFMWKYRRRHEAQRALSQAHHNTALELVWSIIPSILLIPMFWWGYRGYMNMTTPPGDAYEIAVTGKQWKWSFDYPTGHSDDELHVPAGQKIRFLMHSEDVLHSFYVPATRQKFDVIPGRYTRCWFTIPTEFVGHDLPLLCAEYCGKDHSAMTTRVVVHSAEDFPNWLKNADPLRKLTPEQLAEYQKDADAFIKAHPEFPGLLIPAEWGRRLYEKKGCSSCHSIDGKTNTGPTWKDIWGREETVLEGGRESKVVVDENYVKHSVEDPGAQVVKSFDNVMPTFKGRFQDREIWCIAEFMKSLSEKK